MSLVPSRPLRPPSCRPAFGTLALPIVLWAAAAPGAAEPAGPGFQLGVDYALEGRVERNDTSLQSQFLDGRLRTRMATPWGTFVQSGLSTYDVAARRGSVAREEAYWRYADPGSGLVYRAGDFTAGASVGWVRPYDMTGIQVYRRSGNTMARAVDALTPDPERLRNVDPGAWSWDAVPELPAIATPHPLEAGTTDFSLQTGYVRVEHGTAAANYVPARVVSAAMRHGVSDALTAESYVETADGLANRGAGLVQSLGPLGAVGGSAAFSNYRSQRGSQLTASYGGTVGRLGYIAGTQWRSQGFHDVRRMSAQHLADAVSDYRRADSVGVSLALPALASTVRLNYIRVVPPGSPPTSRLVNLSHATAFAGRAAIYTSAYTDVGHADDFGMYVGIRVPIGRAAGGDNRGGFRFDDERAPVSRLQRASATVHGSGRLDPGGVRLEAGLSEAYADEYVW